MNNEPFNPARVRAHFILRGTSLKAWADRRGFKFRHVHQIIHGIRFGNGKTGAQISRELRRELRRTF